MKKKLLAFFLAASMAFALAGCGGSSSGEDSSAQSESAATSEASAAEKTTTASTAEEALDDIKNDFATTIESLETANENAVESTSGSYDDYVANEQLIYDWYEDVHNTSQALFTRTEENAWIYFSLAIEECAGNYSDVDDILDDFYDDIYSGVMDDYYDDVYSDMFDNIYDEVYSDMFDDAYDTTDSKEWHEAWSNCHSAWSDAWSDTHELWSDASSELHSIWSIVYRETSNDNYDIDAIRTTYENRKTANAARAETIISDFSDTITALQESQAELFVTVGDTYEEYVSNKQLVSEWCSTLKSETTALFERTVENAWLYFQEAASEYEDDYYAMSDAASYFYNKIYDDAVDTYYDSVYNDLMTNLYEQYYDGIIDDAYDDFSYEEISDASDEAYDLYSDTESNVYALIQNVQDELYSIYDAVTSAMWEDNYDIDAIRAAYESESSETSEDTEHTENADASSETQSEEPEDAESEELVDGMRPEIKQAIDDYEAFFDEYCEFMLTYYESDDAVSMLADYAVFMAQYATTMSSLEAMEDEDLNDAELLYYTEALARITQDLADLAVAISQ